MADFDALSLLEALADPLLAADAEGRIVYANPAAERLLGFGRGELIGRPLDAILPQRRGPARRKDGPAVEVDPSWHVAGPWQVTTLRPGELPVTTRAELAHEINNPLVYVTLGLELIDRELTRLRGRAPSDEEWDRLKGYAREALEGAERVRGVVRGLLKLSRDGEGPPAPVETGKVRRRLMLVDDDPHLGVTLSTGLRDESDVVAVRSGREAVKLLLMDDRFDLVLCDLMIPDLPGMEVFEEVVRARPHLRGRFVFTTGGAATERAQKFLEQVRRLDKPFRLEQIEMLLRSSRA